LFIGLYPFRHRIVVKTEDVLAAFRGFLPRKTTPLDLYEATVIAKPL
jgi:hypothetical protein